MKKTIYFVGTASQFGQIKSTIDSAIQQRDEFLEENKNLIVKIDNEDISFITQSNTQSVIGIIKLTYYPK